MQLSYDFQVIRRVEFSETDMEGIMHFSNFFRFMETAEHAFFRSLGHSVVLSRSGLSLCLPRVHAECDYLAPLRFEDEVLIHMLVEKKGSRSLTYQFRFFRFAPRGPALAARGRVVVVSARRQKNGGLKAVPLPKFIREKMHAAPVELLSSSSPPSGAGTPSNNGNPVLLHRSTRISRSTRNPKSKDHL